MKLTDTHLSCWCKKMKNAKHGGKLIVPNCWLEIEWLPVFKTLYDSMYTELFPDPKTRDKEMSRDYFIDRIAR